MNCSISNLSLVIPIGPSGSGKSTFAQKHFVPVGADDPEVSPPTQMAVFERIV